MRRLLAILVIVSAAAAAEAENQYVPVAGVVNGVNNTRFRTDVRIYNGDPIRSIDVTVHFLPTGMDGSNIPGNVVEVGPGEMRVLDDIVGTLFGLQAPALGALRFDSDQAPLSFPFEVTSRTYTDSPNPAVAGTLGQFIPAIPVEEAVNDSIVLHVSHSNDFSTGSRTNAGVMNPNRFETVVSPHLVRADGTLISQGADFVVPPMSMIQRSVSEMFGPFDVENGYLVFLSTEPVFTWASIIDNRSGDSFFVRGKARR